MATNCLRPRTALSWRRIVCVRGLLYRGAGLSVSADCPIVAPDCLCPRTALSWRRTDALLRPAGRQDFTPGWYASIGSSLFLTHITQCTLPYLFRFASFAVDAARAAWASRSQGHSQARGWSPANHLVGSDGTSPRGGGWGGAESA